MKTHLDTLPHDVIEHIYRYVHNSHIQGVCHELSVFTKGLYGDPLFLSLSYEGFRPFDPTRSGARDIAVYMGDCWHPYLYSNQCGDGWIIPEDEFRSESEYSSEEDLSDHSTD